MPSRQRRLRKVLAQQSPASILIQTLTGMIAYRNALNLLSLLGANTILSTRH